MSVITVPLNKNGWKYHLIQITHNTLHEQCIWITTFGIQFSWKKIRQPHADLGRFSIRLNSRLIWIWLIRIFMVIYDEPLSDKDFSGECDFQLSETPVLNRSGCEQLKKTPKHEKDCRILIVLFINVLFMRIDSRVQRFFIVRLFLFFVFIYKNTFFIFFRNVFHFFFVFVYMYNCIFI